MKKSIVTTLAISLGLASGLTVTATTASAKTVSSMPASLCHRWYRGKQEVKFTKHTAWFGKKGHKGYTFHFKHVYKYGSSYTPSVNGDIGGWKYSHGYMYSNDGSGWMRYHR